MKTFKRLINKICCILLCSFMISCSEKDDIVTPSPEPEPTPMKTNYLLKDGIVEIKGNDLKYIIEAQEGSILVLSNDFPSGAMPSVGEIVFVYPNAEKLVHGFLGKVSKIEQSSEKYQLITEQVALDEAFSYLEVDETIDFEPVSVDEKSTSRLAVENINGFNCLTQGLEFTLDINKYIKSKVNGKLTLGMRINSNIHIDDKKNKKDQTIKFSIYISFNATTHFTCSVDGDNIPQLEPVKIPLTKNYKIPAGAVSLFASPEIAPKLVVELDAALNVGLGYDFSGVQTYIVKCKDGKWSFEHDKTNSTVNEPALNLLPQGLISMEGSAFAGIATSPEVKLFGRDDMKITINPTIGLRGKAELNYNSETDKSFYDALKDESLSLSLATKADVEANANILKWQAKWSADLFDIDILPLATRHFFPSFTNNSILYTPEKFDASTTIGRDLLCKQYVGLALYKGDDCIQLSDPIEYKNKDEFKDRNPLNATFEEVAKNEKDNYSIWTYVKWNDNYIKCHNLQNSKPEAVDLGLSVKWANCNIGAGIPEDYGNYFAFGDVIPKSPTWEDWNNPRTLKLWGDTDAAYTLWGNNWRMPTKADCEELLRECTWKLVHRGIIKGYEITGPNGNSIFLPLTGRYGGDTQNYEARYRTSDAELLDGDSFDEYSTVVLELQKNFSDTEIDYVRGLSGHPIRPVEIDLIGKWIREDCQCDPPCHYKFKADSTGYYSETYEGHVYKSSFTWSFDGKFLKLTKDKVDSSDDNGVDVNKIVFQSGNRFAEFGEDYNFEETELNTTYFYRIKED